MLRSSAHPAPGRSPGGASVSGETRGRCPPFEVRLRESEVESIKPLHAHPAVRNGPQVPGGASAGVAGEAIPIDGRTDPVVDVSEALTVDHGLTCVLVDDHPAVLDAVSRFLESTGVTVVAALSNGTAAVDEIERLRPAVAVVDLHLPDIDGIELARRVIEKNGRGTAILLYTGYGDVARLTDAVDAGISGFLVKDAPLSELIQAIRMVSGGAPYIDPTLATPLLSGMGAEPAGLTGDERTLMRMLAEGLTTEDIALALSASRTTAQARIADVMRKLNADTRAQAVGVAIRDGWIV